MTFTVPRLTDARAVLCVSAILAAPALATVSMACTGTRHEDKTTPPPQVAPRDDEKRFTSDEGWSFLAPKDFERSTAPGTTGFAVYRPPPAKPILNIILTTEAFDGNVSAFVDKERAKIKIVKEERSGSGVTIEETWSLGEGESGIAMVFLAVQNGVGIRLACLGKVTDFDAQRPICERALQSLRR